jgi:hypothetical protein
MLGQLYGDIGEEVKARDVIKKMKEDRIFTCWLYWESKKAIKELEPKLEEVKNQIVLDKAEREEIIKQIPNVYE